MQGSSWLREPPEARIIYRESVSLRLAPPERRNASSERHVAFFVDVTDFASSRSSSVAPRCSALQMPADPFGARGQITSVRSERAASVVACRDELSEIALVGCVAHGRIIIRSRWRLRKRLGSGRPWPFSRLRAAARAAADAADVQYGHKSLDAQTAPEAEAAAKVEWTVWGRTPESSSPRRISASSHPAIRCGWVAELRCVPDVAHRLHRLLVNPRQYGVGYGTFDGSNEIDTDVFFTPAW